MPLNILHTNNLNNGNLSINHNNEMIKLALIGKVTPFSESDPINFDLQLYRFVLLVNSFNKTCIDTIITACKS